MYLVHTCTFRSTSYLGVQVHTSIIQVCPQGLSDREDTRKWKREFNSNECHVDINRMPL